MVFKVIHPFKPLPKLWAAVEVLPCVVPPVLLQVILYCKSLAAILTLHLKEE